MSRGKTIVMVLLFVALAMMVNQVLASDYRPRIVYNDTLRTANPWKEAIEVGHSGQKGRISHHQQILISAIAILFAFSFLYVLKYGKEST